MSLALDPNSIWRDFVTDRIPASGLWEPRKAEIRQFESSMRQAVIALLADADPELELPNLLITATDEGAGTPNAIEATTNLPIPGEDAGSLIALTVFEDNTASPVTVSFNGAAALTIKTNTGNDIAPGGLVDGMIVIGLVSGTTFRIVTDQVSSAIVAAAEAAQAAAEAAAASLNFPTIQTGDSGKKVVISETEDGYEYVEDAVTESFASKAAAEAFEPDTAPNFIRLVGYYAAGDGGGALYKTAASEPTHAGKFSITLSDGVTVQWYEIAATRANIRAFGARHTEANNAPFIQAAIDWACNTLKGPEVYFPSVPTGQTYNITETITITKKVKIKGAHPDVMIYATMPTAQTLTFNVDGDVAPNLEDVIFEDITLRSDTATRCDAIAFTNTAYIVMRNVLLYNVRNGLIFYGTRSFSNKFDNVRVFPKATGTAVQYASSFGGGGQHHFSNCTFCAATGFNLAASATIAGLVFTSCNFEQCTDALRLLGTAFGVALHGCYAEKNGVNYTFAFFPASGQVQAGISIAGCFFETDGEAYPIILGSAGGTVTGITVTGNYARDYTTAFIRFNAGTVAGGAVEGNYITAIPTLFSNGSGTSIRAAGNRDTGGDQNT